MAKTTADVPRTVASEYAKTPRPDAVASADADGYTKTKKMQKAQQPGKSSSQFGLPPSPGKGSGKGLPPGKGPGLHLRISVRPDTDKDMM